MIIKVVLLVAIAVIALVAFRPKTSARSRLAARGLLAATLLFATASVIHPATLTALAHVLGVGRGTDLLVYLLAVTFGIVTVSLYGRLLELENRFVVLARRLAIAEARAEEQDSRT